jgi:hypothetical protein
MPDAGIGLILWLEFVDPSTPFDAELVIGIDVTKSQCSVEGRQGKSVWFRLVPGALLREALEEIPWQDGHKAATIVAKMRRGRLRESACVRHLVAQHLWKTGAVRLIVAWPHLGPAGARGRSFGS